MTETETNTSAWFKSSYSGSEAGSDCVEVAVADEAMRVRDSKRPAESYVAVGSRAWTAFVRHVAHTR